jgi:rubrerythrin
MQTKESGGSPAASPGASGAPVFDARTHTTTRFALDETRTQDLVKAAFAVDAQAAAILSRFARVAEIEGLPEVARTLRELAESRENLAHGHLDFLFRTGEPLANAATGDTGENLRAALAIEAEHGAALLAEQGRTAQAEGFADIASWLETVGRTREFHAARLQDALTALITPRREGGAA